MKWLWGGVCKPVTKSEIFASLSTTKVWYWLRDKHSLAPHHILQDPEECFLLSFGNHLNYLNSVPVDGSIEGKFLFFPPLFFFGWRILYQGGTCLFCLLAFANIRKVPILPSKKDFYILVKYITTYSICE